MNVTSQVRKLVFSRQSHKLYHYQSLGENKRAPILIVFALVNTPKILDLHPKCSFIQALQTLGHDVYLLEWGVNEHSCCKQVVLNDYCYEIIDTATHYLYQLTGRKIHLLGVCQGGFFSLCYATLMPQRLASLILMVTPIDFSVPNRLMQLIRYLDLEHLKESFERIPGWMLQMFLQQVEPFRSSYKHWGSREVNIHMALQKWLNDYPEQPVFALYQFAQLARSNALLNKTLMMNKKTVDVTSMQLPVLNILSKHDHFWPTPMVEALKDHYCGKRYQQIVYDGGHVGVFISQKSLKVIPKNITQWVCENSYHY